jgi:O-antigen/teichoic acid export membrane protein
VPYQMSIWKQIVSGVAALSGSNLVGMVSGVAQASLTLRYLEVSDFGRLTLMLSFYSMAAHFLTEGMGRLVTAEVARERGAGETGRARFLFSRFQGLLIFSGSTVCLIFMGIGYQQGEILWFVMGAYLLLTAQNKGFRVLFNSHLRYGNLAAQEMIESLSRLLLLITLPWWNMGSVLTAVALTYPLMECFVLAFSLWAARPIFQSLREAPAQKVDLKKLLLRQGVYVILGLHVLRFTYILPVWILKWLAGDSAVGIYGAARKGWSLVSSGFTPLRNVLFPLVSGQAQREPERIRVVLRQAQKYSFWATLALVLLLIPLAPTLISLLAGPGYEQAVPVFQWLAGSLILDSFTRTYPAIFYSVGAQRQFFSMRLLRIFTPLPLLFLGVWWNGVVGAAQFSVIHGTLFLWVNYQMINQVAPHLWVSPMTVFRLEDFDRKLFRLIKDRIAEWTSVGHE